jgi:hypothetical protein
MIDVRYFLQRDKRSSDSWTQHAMPTDPTTTETTKTARAFAHRNNRSLSHQDCLTIFPCLSVWRL